MKVEQSQNVTFVPFELLSHLFPFMKSVSSRVYFHQTNDNEFSLLLIEILFLFYLEIQKRFLIGQILWTILQSFES